MKYYVSVGSGGIVFKAGMLVTGLIGSVVYWRASRRRGGATANERDAPTRHPADLFKLRAGQLASPAAVTGTIDV